MRRRGNTGQAFQSTRCQIRHWIARIDKQPKLRSRRHKLPQQLQLFGHQHVGQKAHTRPPMRAEMDLPQGLRDLKPMSRVFISHHSGGSPL
jgi:calcineurin-like phosphoesterase family protein